MSFHFLPFHMWPGAHVYVMWLSVIDYNIGETLNKPTDIFGQVAHSLDLYFIVFCFFGCWEYVQIEMDRGLSLETGLISLKGSCCFSPSLLWRTGYKVGIVMLWLIYKAVHSI